MPKAERGSVKDLAKRMKMKGLQKLKFYCQMCEKQCRDANGFKCHLTSESHLRQMKLFSDNAGGILNSFSKDFEKAYLSTLRMRHGTKNVNANNVYQEMISDKQHIHMNATHWATLSDFVQYLGKSGKCVVEETERGWFISYIERDASILARQEAMQRREEAEKAQEEALAERMELQRIEAAKALDRAGGSLKMDATNLQRSDHDRPIQVSLGKTSRKSKMLAASTSVFENDDEDDDEEEEKLQERAPKAPIFSSPTPPTVNNRSQSIQVSNESKKRKIISEAIPTSSKKVKDENVSKYRNDFWLYRNILVRIISKKLAGGKYFKRKAIVNRVIDKYTAEVEVLDSDRRAKDGGDILRLDQDDLDTVIPKEVGKKVRILNGKYRPEKAIVEKLDKARYQATLRLLHDDKVLECISYEDFSKLA